jgi:hypothetical protein
MEQLRFYPLDPNFGPIKAGQVIAVNGGACATHRVQHVDENVAGFVFACVNLQTGAHSVVLAHEVAYRLR